MEVAEAHGGRPALRTTPQQPYDWHPKPVLTRAPACAPQWRTSAPSPHPRAPAV